MEPRESHVLVADDEPQVLTLFERLLNRAGYAVTAVPSGAAALEAMANQRVDLLILDLNMPSPDGFDLLRTLRKSKPGLRVLVVSGDVDAAPVLPATKFLGATAWLNKSDAARLLVPTVNTLLH